MIWESIESMTGLTLGTPARFVIAFILVLILIALTFAILRSIGMRGSSGDSRKGPKRPRLSMGEWMRVDDKRRLVIVRRDDIEHLLLVGGTSDLVVERDLTSRRPAMQIAVPSPQPDVLTPPPEPRLSTDAAYRSPLRTQSAFKPEPAKAPTAFSPVTAGLAGAAVGVTGVAAAAAGLARQEPTLNTPSASAASSPAASPPPLAQEEAPVAVAVPVVEPTPDEAVAEATPSNDPSLEDDTSVSISDFAQKLEQELTTPPLTGLEAARARIAARKAALASGATTTLGASAIGASALGVANLGSSASASTDQSDQPGSSEETPIEASPDASDADTTDNGSHDQSDETEVPVVAPEVEINPDHDAPTRMVDEPLDPAILAEIGEPGTSDSLAARLTPEPGFEAAFEAELASSDGTEEADDQPMEDWVDDEASDSEAEDDENDPFADEIANQLLEEITKN